GSEKRDALKLGRPTTCLSSGIGIFLQIRSLKSEIRSAATILSGETGLTAWGYQDRSCFIHRLLQLHHIVRTSKPESVDLKPSCPAGRALPVKRLGGDEEPRFFQVHFRVWIYIIEGGGENPRLHGHHSSNEAVDARGAESVSDLGFE